MTGTAQELFSYSKATSAPRARRRDPETSHAAGQLAFGFADTHKARILRAIAEAGPAAPPKLELLTGLSVVQIDRRMVELQRDGLVKVVQAGGRDLAVGGFRVWELA